MLARISKTPKPRWCTKLPRCWDLKMELEKEKVARKMAQAKVDTLTRAIKDLKISADKFTAQVLILEEKIKHLDNKVIDGLKEIRAKELDLERKRSKMTN
jgi:hypothetical protein